MLQKDNQIYYPPPREMRAKFAVSPSSSQIEEYFKANSRKLDDLFRWPRQRGGELTDIGILRHMVAKNILIEPFDIQLLQSNGYDVRLGRWFWEINDPKETNGSDKFARLSHKEGTFPILDPLDKNNVLAIFLGPKEATPFQDLLKEQEQHKKAISRKEWGSFLEGVNGDDQVIIISPRQNLLCHTEEFIGGSNVVDTSISGKSTTGRIGVEVCSDANKGDIGFRSRWTLEITNKHTGVAVLLLVGQPYATITFSEVERPVRQYVGSYQQGRTLGELAKDWNPERMLPRMKRIKVTE